MSNVFKIYLRKNIVSYIIDYIIKSSRNFNNYYYFFIFLAPLYYLPAFFMPGLYIEGIEHVEKLYYLNYIKDILWLILVFLFLTVFFFSEKVKKNTRGFLKKGLNSTIVILFCITFTYATTLGFINAAISLNLNYTGFLIAFVLGLRQFFEFVFMAFITYVLINSKDDIKVILKIIFISGFFVMFFGYIQIAFFSSINPASYGGIIARTYSTLLNPNNLASFIGLILLLLVPLYIKCYRNQLSRFKKIVFDAYFIFMTILLFTTISLSGIFGILVGFIVIYCVLKINWYGLVNYKLINLKSVFINFLILTILLVGFLTYVEKEKLAQMTHLPSFIMERVTNVVSGQDKSLNTRKTILANYFSEEASSSWYYFTFGKGLYFSLRFTKGIVNEEQRILDNFYLQLHRRIGILGLLLFMGVFVVGMIKAYQTYRYSSDLFIKMLTLGIFGFFAHILFKCLFLEILSNQFPTNMFCWLLIGIILTFNTKIKVNNDEITHLESNDNFLKGESIRPSI
jgi:O-antigen ligase